MNFLLIDDHPLYTQGLETLLSSYFETATIQSECDIVGAIERETNTSLDLIFLDLVLQDGQGVGNIEVLRRRFGDLPIIAMTGYATDDLTESVEEMGASAFLSKIESPEDIIATINMVLSGKRVFPAHSPIKKRPNEHGAWMTPLEVRLTKRENEVFKCLSKGLTNLEAAHALKIREKTVKTHVSNIFRKYGVGRRSELFALLMARHEGYRDTGDRAERLPRGE
ncbi:MAG: response regulator transcription factor [Paracoccaceae bacterium]